LSRFRRSWVVGTDYEERAVRVVVTGASGQLGAYATPALRRAGHEVLGWGIEGAPRVDLTDARTTLARLDAERPDAIIHLAAVSSYEAVFRDPRRGEAVNVAGTRVLADWCRANGRPLVFTSTDAVFDGAQGWYHEGHRAKPILAYGRTKLAAEASVLDVPGGLVARLSLLFGPSRCGRVGSYDRSLAALRRGETLSFFEDEYRTPLDYATAATILVRLFGSGATGLVHVGGRERLSRFDLMRRAVPALAIDPSLIRANRRADVLLTEPRPADTSLDTTRLASLLPDLERPGVAEAVAAMEASATSDAASGPLR
jgi:dTDP-4-dehydrorhamnose reductase